MDPWNIIGWIALSLIGLWIVILFIAFISGCIQALLNVRRYRRISKMVDAMKESKGEWKT